MATPIAAVFDKALAGIAIDQLKTLLGAGSENFDFTVAAGGTYSPHEFTVKLKVGIKGGVNADRVELERYCKLFGFAPDAELHSSTLGSFKLVRYDQKKPRYPWIVLAENGKQYKVAQDGIEQAFKRLEEQAARTASKG